jgi:hypothetical protein
MHWMPQSPQLFRSTWALTHELPHAVSPVAHLSTHLLCEHLSCELHAVPHAPQLAASEARSLHAPLHWVCPVGHAHLLAHLSCELHAVPHAPQLAASEARSLHAPLHWVCPVGHAHLLAWQVIPLAHCVLQPPHARGSLVVSTQTPSQKVCAALGHVSTQTPALHFAPTGHAWPQ